MSGVNTTTNTNTGVSVGTNNGIAPQTGGGGQVIASPGGGVQVATPSGTSAPQVSSSGGWGGWGESSSSGSYGWGGEVSSGPSAEEIAAAERERAAMLAAMERAVNEQKRRTNDKEIAKKQQDAQRERKSEKQTPAAPKTMSSPSVETKKNDGKLRAGEKRTTYNPVSRTTTEYTGLGGDEDWAGIYDDYYSFPDEKTNAITKYISPEDKAVGNDAFDAEDEYYRQVGPVFSSPDGYRGTADELKSKREEEMAAINARRQRLEGNVRGTMDRIRQRFDKPINAAMRQRLTLGARDAMRRIENSRYHSPNEIHDAIMEEQEAEPEVKSYVNTPASDSDRSFKFADDEALEPRIYSAEQSNEEIANEVRKRVSPGLMAQIAAKNQSKNTSIDAQSKGYVEFDPESTAADNVRNAQRAADSTARIISNPLLVNIEGTHVERTEVEGDPGKVSARIRHSNEQGLDVEGAIGMVRRIFGCSYMNALRLVFIRLGLGVDSKNQICGKDLDEFVLPATVFIEAANDIKKSMEAYGIPFSIVDGRPGGYSNSRDDSGMFPVLGGTRCYPLGYMPNFMFDDMSRDPNSPLYGKNKGQFDRACALTWMNDTQPRILANTNGPLAWQASALEMAMRGIMSIDGMPPTAFKVPEYQVNRTKMQIEAELADAGDEAMREAFEEKRRIAPEIMSRWCHMNFKDAGARDKEVEDLEGEFVSPGKQRRRGMLDGIANTFMSLETLSSVIRLGLMITSPLEGAVSTAQQQVVISSQNAFKNHISKKYKLGDRFGKSEYLREVAESEDALEALETYRTLMDIGGRTAVDAFRLDRNDSKTGQRYHATKADMVDFLNRWGASQGTNIQQKINKLMDNLMFGDGMFRKTKAQQFVDMALYEMMQSELRGRQAFDVSQLEEIARSGESRRGAGEALISALIDTEAGYEAFKTMGVTSLARTTPWGRATQLLLQKNGVTELAIRNTINKFPMYGINKISRMVPMSNTISYVISNLTKYGMLKASEDMELANGFARGYDKVAQMVSRMSNYQVGMNYENFDWNDFKHGLYKNLAYDVVMFGGNYIMTAAIIRGVMALFGGIIPPDDKEKMTLPEEWIIKDLGVPIKAAWFMDDLIGCGLPLAYAWAISEGWDERDKDGNVVRHVDANSDEALGTASSAFINMVASFNEGNFVVDAIDFVTNFGQNFDELAGWKDRSVKEMREYYGDKASEMSDSDLRTEWLWARCEGVIWDMFGSVTPHIINEILPGTRDSFWNDGYTHTTKKGYDTENYSREQAEREWRTKSLSYRDAERCRHSQDSVIGAFLMDLLDTRDGIEYQYRNMPIDTTADPRTLAGESYERKYGLNLELDNGNPNLDLDGDGKNDTAEERESFLFNRAEEVCQDIYDRYILSGKYPESAIAEGFVIPFDARLNVKNYCYYMIGSKNRQGKIWQDFYERKEREGYLPQEDYLAAQAEVQRYTDILYNYIENKDIPWRAPRYAHLSTDRNTMYVDENGNATNVLDPNARRITYDYGNEVSGIAPFVSPRNTGNNDYNSSLWDVMLDDNGQPINDMSRIYDEAQAAGDVTMGRWTGNNVLDMFTNNGVLERGDVLNLGRRAYEPFVGTYPDALKDPTADTIARILGIASYIPDEETVKDSSGDTSDSKSGSGGNSYGGGSYGRRGYGGRSYGGRSYGGGSYYRGYGGRSYSYSSSGYSAYNPKIYSNPRQVYSDRASGLQIRQPYKATSTYLRPNFYTKGSREAYKRQDL